MRIAFGNIATTESRTIPTWPGSTWGVNIPGILGTDLNFQAFVPFRLDGKLFAIPAVPLTEVPDGEDSITHVDTRQPGSKRLRPLNIVG